MAKVETLLGRVWKVSRAYRFACGELWACSNCVWRTFVGQCWRHQLVRWACNRHGARNFCFAIYVILILSLSRTIVSSPRTHSIARSHVSSVTLSLARFLPASPTHSVAHLFPVFPPPLTRSLRPFLTYLLDRLLPPLANPTTLSLARLLPPCLP